MSTRIEQSQPVVTSVFDRLTDEEPSLRREVVKAGPQAVRDLKQAVRRDLERMLNTRRRLLSLPDDLTELGLSVVNYGLPDFNSAHVRAAQEPRIFLATIAEAIRRFEPRLTKVRVEMLSQPGGVDRVLRFRIDGVLDVEPILDSVSFNSSFVPLRGAFEIQKGGA
jgi:type VI secretion system protein ImpF